MAQFGAQQVAAMTGAIHPTRDDYLRAAMARGQIFGGAAVGIANASQARGQAIAVTALVIEPAVPRHVVGVSLRGARQPRFEGQRRQPGGATLVVGGREHSFRGLGRGGGEPRLIRAVGGHDQQ